MTLEQAVAIGFDDSYELDKSEDDDLDRYIRIRCSQCSAACVNGAPCHEHGCPNSRKKKSRYDEYTEDDDE